MRLTECFKSAASLMLKINKLNAMRAVLNDVLYKVFNVCLFSLFNGISAFVSKLMPRPSFEKNSSGTI